MNEAHRGDQNLAMNEPNVEEIVTYLSTKFNKIFYDREFVSCVSNDFHKLKYEINKCCVLVFPALEPHYQRALKYQAKAFDLASFGISGGRPGATVKTIAVCQKDHLLQETRPESIQQREKMSSDSLNANKDAGTNVRRKRPERPLYVPPAQRRLNKDVRAETRGSFSAGPMHLIDGTKNKTHSLDEKRKYSDRKSSLKTQESDSKIENENQTIPKPRDDKLIVSLHDLLHLNFLPLPKYSSSLNHKIDHDTPSLSNYHNSCQFYKYLSSNCKNDFHFRIPVYHPSEIVSLQVLIDNYQCWQPDTTDDFIDNDEIFENNCAIPFFNYIKNADSEFLNSDTIDNLTLNQVKLCSKIKSVPSGRTSVLQIESVCDKTETDSIFNDELKISNLLRIVCDNEPFENIVDLTSFRMGHYFNIPGPDGSEYFHVCDEKHDVLQCYMDVKQEKFPENTSSTSESSSSQNPDSEIDIKENAVDPIEKENETPSPEVVKKPEVNVTKEIKDSKTKCQHEEEKEIMRKAKENINRRTRPLMKYSDDGDDFLKIDKQDNVNNWEDLFDDNGHLQEELLTEIENKVGKDLKIVKATEDYTPYMQKPAENLEHVVEIYNFPPSLSTGDIIHAFSIFDSDSMYIVWVDDTHALLVLGSLNQAQKAVEMKNPMIKVRPMSSASPGAMATASQYDLKPAMKRPQTNLQTARRLITNHLGTKSKVTKEQTAMEREHLRKAREQRNITRQNEKDAWEGNIRSSLRQ